MKRASKFSPEVQQRAVRMVVEAQGQHNSQWAAIESIAAKIGCMAETLRRWVRQHERDTGQREGLTTAEAQRIRDLERENRELRKANEIFKLASAFFARTELDDRIKSWRPSSTSIVSALGSSRPAAACSSPRRRTGAMQRGSAIRRCARFVPRVTRDSCLRSSAYGNPTWRSMALTRSGASSTARVWPLRAARSSS